MYCVFFTPAPIEPPPLRRILPTVRCEVSASEVLNTGRFSLAQAAQADGWGREVEAAAGGPATHTPETEEYGIASVTFRARRPFHPRRLWDKARERWARGTWAQTHCRLPVHVPASWS